MSDEASPPSISTSSVPDASSLSAESPLADPSTSVIRLGSVEVAVPPLLKTRGAGGTPAHKLQSAWAFWAQKKVSKRAGAAATTTGGGGWAEGMTILGRFDTVEGFWQLFSVIARAEAVPGSADVMLFRDGIRPLWEDPANKGGGKWTLRMRKGGAGAVWEELVLALVGETLDATADVTGASLSIRHNDLSLSVWHRTADSDAVMARLR